MKIVRVICTAAMFLFVLGCGDNAKNTSTYSTDLINNPNTADANAKAIKMPKITFNKKSHDFGKLSRGESISYSFKFTNTGDADLLISDCDATCGCTVADYPKNPIKPGEVGYITVTFNSAGKYGQEEQMVDVMANTQPSKSQLIIRAMVEN